MASQKIHPLFTRDGDDIHQTVELSLHESLCGWKRTVSIIDRKQINIEKQGPTQPGSREIYPDLGMPYLRLRNQEGIS